MKWLEISLTVNGELVEPIADLFMRASGAGVILEPQGSDSASLVSSDKVTVRTYLRMDGSLQEQRSKIAQGLWFLSKIQALPEPRLRQIEEQDWANTWKAHYQPILAGRSLLIHPRWLPAPDTDRLPVIIDPGMAFGTGTHPTTRLCLELLEDYLSPGQVAADIGCGTGILSIAAVRLGAHRVVAVDIDPMAVRVAQENIELNGVAQRVRVRAGSLPELQQLAENECLSPDLVMANIIAPVICEMLTSGLGAAAEPGGKLLISGFLEDQVTPILSLANESGLRAVEIREEMDWRAMVLETPN